MTKNRPIGTARIRPLLLKSIVDCPLAHANRKQSKRFRVEFIHHITYNPANYITRKDRIIKNVKVGINTI